MLHQSVQHICMALFRIMMGYRSNTHNLIRLLLLTGCFSPRLLRVFPGSTKEETELFDYLQEAYAGARYKEEYSVPADKATILVRRVKLLLSFAEQLYADKFITLEEAPIFSFPLTPNHAPEKD
ncbi:HEPN domain-containing protein [Paraflavitalea speifideaquila]|uniref:HEPN domain-containing protein n=1 Tax=Paraflavitalea speifideaquila TaxID=3076558 RepID=UPI0028EA7D8E|nr:HEPN domain-containing protein [Paraflavitalea speifideiaquila]